MSVTKSCCLFSFCFTLFFSLSSISSAQDALIIDSGGNVIIGKDNPGVSLQVYGTLEVDGAVGYPIPKGGIILWSGAIADIPSGWALCDGENGTPNLIDKFVLGTNTEPNAEGGAKEISLDISQMPTHTHGGAIADGGAHAHTWNGYREIPAGGSAHDVRSREKISDDPQDISTDSNGSHSHTLTIENSGESAPITIMPPYWTLAYIMKL